MCHYNAAYFGKADGKGGVMSEIYHGMKTFKAPAFFAGQQKSTHIIGQSDVSHYFNAQICSTIVE